jgi:hypothetical protein
MSTVPHRIRDVLAKPVERRTATDRQRLAAWDRREARRHVEALDAELDALGVLLDLEGVGPLYHDPRRPVFSEQCRVGRPAECRWYPCCNDVHPDPARLYRGLRRRLYVDALGRAS